MEQKKEKNQQYSIGRGFWYFLLASSLLFLLFFTVFKLSHQIYKQNQINEEVGALQGEIEQLNQENQNLNELITYLQTDDFKEKEAKDKLNLIKEGEQLVLIKEHELKGETEQATKATEAEVILHHANYYYWWHYFFSIKK